MGKRYFAMLLTVVTIFSQVLGTGSTVTATEIPENMESAQEQDESLSDETEMTESLEELSITEDSVDVENSEVIEELNTESDVSEEPIDAKVESETGGAETSVGVEEIAVNEEESETTITEEFLPEETVISEEAEATLTEDILPEETVVNEEEPETTVAEEGVSEETSESTESDVPEASETTEALIEAVSESEVIIIEDNSSNESKTEKAEFIKEDGISTFSDDEDWEATISCSEDLREEDYTWIFVGESQTFTADIVNPTGEEYTLTWEVGTINNEDDSISESDAISYTVADDASSVTITGESGAGELAMRVAVIDTASGIEVTEVYLHFEIREEIYDYRLPVEDDVSQLPYWDMVIDKYFNYYIENPEYPYGAEFTGEITSLTVENASDDEGEGDAVTLYEWEDGNGWNLHMERFGHAVCTFTYNDCNGQKIEKNFNIWIGSEVYRLGIESVAGVEQILPGEAVDLTAYFSLECFDEENGHYQGNTDGVTFEWSIEDENITDEVLTIEQDSNEPSILHVNIAENTGNYGMWIPIAVRAYMQGEEVAYQCFHMNICDNYYRLDPIYMETSELGVGEEVEIVPALYKHTYGEEISDLTEGAQFRFEWDTNAIQITDGNGKILTNEDAYGTAPYTLNKLQNWHTNVTLVAELTDEEGNHYEAMRRSWDFFDVNYDVWFYELRGDGNTWIFTNENSGEDYNLLLDTTNLDIMNEDTNNCSLVWEVGFCDDEGNYYYTVPASDTTYSYDETNKALILHGNGLWDALVSQYEEEPWDIWFNVRVIVKVGNVEVEREDISVQLRPEVYDYDFPVGDGMGMLPFWSHGIDKNLNYYVENAQYPHGRDLSTTITSVSVENAPDDEGEDEVAVIRAWDDGKGWELHVNRYGHAIGTLTYTAHNGQTEEKIFDIWVGSDVYELNISSSSGVKQMLPGESMDLSAAINHECYSEEMGHYPGSIEGITYEWMLEDENCNSIMSMEPDREEPTILHVNVPDTEAAMGWTIPISLRAYIQGENGKEEVAYSNYHIYVCNEYYRLDPIHPNTQELAVGESVTVTPELYYHCYQKEVEMVTENVQYRVEWDTNAIEVTDGTGTVLSDGNAVGTAPFTFKKLQNWHTNMNFIAERPGEEGDYNEVTRRFWDFYEVDYSVYFKDLRGDGHTWIFTNEGDGEAYELSLDTQNLEGKTYDVQWEVGICDENGNFTYSVGESNTTYSVKNDKTTVTLYANGLWDDIIAAQGYTEENMPDNTWFDVRAIVTAGGEEVAQTQTGVNIRKEVCDYRVQSENIHCIPKWKYVFSKNMVVYVENPEYPHGAELETQIVSIEVSNAEDEYGDGEVVNLVEWEGSTGWDMCFNRTGHAVASITYNTLDGQTAENAFDIYIETEMYIMNMWSATGTNCVLPGGNIDLVADINHWCYNEENGENYVENTDDIVFEWTLGNPDCSDIVHMNQDSEDSKLLHVEVGAENSVGWLIPIELRAYVQDGENMTEVAYQSFEIYVAEAYYQLFTEDVIAEPGERVELPAELKLISLDNQEGILQQDVTYSLEAYTDLLQLDETGTGLEVLTDVIPAEDTPASVLVKVMADMTNEHGDQIHEEAEAYIIICVHDYKQTASTPSTCTKHGSITYNCEKCGHEKTEEQPLLAHTVVTDKAVAATCTKTGLTEGSHCSVCKKVIVAQNTTKALGHTIVTDKAIAATCTKTGLTEGSHCSVCKQIIVAQNTTKALGHTIVTDKAIAATCTKTGLTEGSHCSVCKQIIVAQNTTKALGHTIVTDKAVAATCTKTGLTEGSHCSICKQVIVAQNTTKALGHANTQKLTAAQIGKDGNVVTVCTRCGTVASTTAIPAISVIELSETEYVYNGKECKPSVTVKDNKGSILKVNTDYTLMYASGRKKPGKYTVMVTFKGNYSGTKELFYTINPKNTSISKLTAEKKGFTAKWKKDADVTGYELQYSTSDTFTAKTTKSKTITKNGTTSQKVTGLKETKKYYVRIRTYKAITEKGKETKHYSEWSDVATVITKNGKGKLSAVKSVKLSTTEFVYSGKVYKPTVTVKDKVGNTLEANTDYTVSYSSGCKKPGSYTVTVKFKGNYANTKKKMVTFTILPKSISISKVTAQKKGFKVNWKKDTEITGYEIQYSTTKKFKEKTTKTVTVSSSKTTTKAISKLSAKKKYYVRIRTYKTVKVNGKSTKLYSEWSKTKTVTTKK